MADKVLQPTTAPPLRMAWLLLIALLVLALAGAVAVVGSRLLAPTPVIPQGGAAVFAYSTIAADDPVSPAATSISRERTAPMCAGSPAGLGSKAPRPGRRMARASPTASGRAGTDSIVVMDAGGGNSTTLATTPATASYCARGDLTWSPDGTSLIFPTSPVCDMTFELFIVPADGSSPATRLLAPGLEGRFADWSPDGNADRLPGQGCDRQHRPLRCRCGSGDALGGGLQARRILAPAGVDFANTSGGTWSPDGTGLAVVSGAPATGATASDTRNVVVVKADGSEPQVVAEAAFNPAWSPDGQADRLPPSRRTVGVLRGPRHARLAPGSSMRTAPTNVGSIRWWRVAPRRCSGRPTGPASRAC